MNNTDRFTFLCSHMDLTRLLYIALHRNKSQGAVIRELINEEYEKLRRSKTLMEVFTTQEDISQNIDDSQIGKTAI